MATELHPEELLERDARGELDEVEVEHLEAHLRRCSACRIERVARLDFKREEHELDANGEPLDVPRLLAALTMLAPPAGRGPAGEMSVLKGPRGRHRRFLPLLVAAVLGSAAAWATVAERRVLQAPVTQVSRPAVPSGLARMWGAAVALPPVAVATATPVAPAGAGGSKPSTVLAPPSGRPPELLGARQDQRVAFVASPPAVAPTNSEVRSGPVLAPRAPTSSEASSAGRDFDEANATRRSGDHATAAEQYRALISRYPSTPEAHASLVALGRMLLDDGDAAGALRCFERYLIGGGGLAEDVMLGRAIALRNLGRSAEEQRAWSDLLRRYPASVHAERARRRLAEIPGSCPVPSGCGQLGAL